MSRPKTEEDVRVEVALHGQAIAQVRSEYESLSQAVGKLTETVIRIEHAVVGSKPWVSLAQHLATAALTAVVVSYMKGHQP